MIIVWISVVLVAVTLFVLLHEDWLRRLVTPRVVSRAPA